MRKLDLCDLPAAVLVHIFTTGTRLGVAEQVPSKWRDCIRSNPILWRGACERLKLTEGKVSEELQAKELNEAAVWRSVWVENAKTKCQACSLDDGTFDPLFGKMLCPICKLRKLYMTISKSNAISFVNHNSKKVKAVIEENIICVKSFQPFPEKKTGPILCQFEQLLGIAKMAFGEEKARKK